MGNNFKLWLIGFQIMFFSVILQMAYQNVLKDTLFMFTYFGLSLSWNFALSSNNDSVILQTTQQEAAKTLP